MPARKAQWFIVGGLLIATMILTVALSRNQVQIGTGIEPWQKHIFDNVKKDSISAVNSIVLENASSKNIESRLKDYSNFLRNYGDMRAINISAYFLVGLPAGNGINVTIVNFERNTMRPANVTIGGATQSIPEILDRGASTIYFNSVPDYFTVNYTLTEINKTGEKSIENGTFTTTKKIFSAIKIRISTKDNSQIWQKTEIY